MITKISLWDDKQLTQGQHFATSPTRILRSKDCSGRRHQAGLARGQSAVHVEDYCTFSGGMSVSMYVNMFVCMCV